MGGFLVNRAHVLPELGCITPLPPHHPQGLRNKQRMMHRARLLWGLPKLRDASEEAPSHCTLQSYKAFTAIHFQWPDSGCMGPSARGGHEAAGGRQCRSALYEAPVSEHLCPAQPAACSGGGRGTVGSRRGHCLLRPAPQEEGDFFTAACRVGRDAATGDHVIRYYSTHQQ